MMTPTPSKLLRIYLSESDHLHHAPLYEAIVLEARKLSLAGATVQRAAMGFGASAHLHTTKILQLSMDLPMIVEIIDSQEKIDLLLPFIDQHLSGGLVTLEDITVLAREQPPLMNPYEKQTLSRMDAAYPH